MRRVLLFAGLHLVAFMACLFAALMGSDFDTGSSTPIGRAGDAGVLILSLPGRLLFSLFENGIPDAVEWTVLGANSLLWGWALRWCFGRFSTRPSAGEPAQS